MKTPKLMHLKLYFFIFDNSKVIMLPNKYLTKNISLSVAELIKSNRLFNQYIYRCYW